MRKLTVLVLALTLVMVGCQPIEQSARDGIASAKGFLDSAKAHHPECPAAKTRTCSLISAGVSAKDVTIDALELYCSNAAGVQPSFQDGGPCVPDKSVEPKLKAALKSLDQIVADVKGL